MTVKTMSNCIAIDWLQLHVRVPRRDFENIYRPSVGPLKYELEVAGDNHVKEILKKAGYSPAGKKKRVRVGEGFELTKIESKDLKALDEKYELKKTGIQTRNFKTIYEIKDRATGEDIAVMAAEPRSEMCMDEDSGLIKIINKYLYQKNFSDWVRCLLRDLQLQFLNITRLDIAYDFERFDTMECYDFIRRVMSETYIKTQQNKFKAMGDSISIHKGKKTGGVDSLKYGKETSDVSYYLYNKTKELQQVKHKPWIHDHWRSNGWQGDTDVFRLEFSLRPDTKGIAQLEEMIDEETGELRMQVTGEVYHFKDLSMIDHINDIFVYHFNKHFAFVRAERTKKGNWKKQSRCKPVKLFRHLRFEGVKIALSDKKDSGRADKIFAKKLMQLNNELRGVDFDLAIAGNELMTWVIKMRDLTTWAKNKFPDITYSDRLVNKFLNARTSGANMAAHQLRKLPSVNPSAKDQEIALIDVETKYRTEKIQAEIEQKIKIDEANRVCGGCGHKVMSCECIF